MALTDEEKEPRRYLTEKGIKALTKGEMESRPYLMEERIKAQADLKRKVYPT
jgi:hypothetical protein